jgi:hypothetical protein
MYCPICRAEYREGFFECTDCDVDLVEKLEPLKELPGFVKLATIFSEGDIAVITRFRAAIRILIAANP